MLTLSVKPLSAEREQELSRKAKAGDVASRNKLVEAYIPLVMYMVSKRKLSPSDAQDATQRGCMGLLTAADRWDSSYGVRFLTYASNWVRAALSTLPINLDMSLEEPKDSESLAPLDVLSDGKSGLPQMEQLLTRRSVRKLLTLSKLSEVEAEVVRQRWLSGDKVSLKEIGTRLGVCSERVRQIEAEAFEKLEPVLRELA